MEPTWLAWHVYPHETHDVFLVRAVLPFLEQQIWPVAGTRAFFVRYADEKGPHIRLRFRGESDWLEQTLRPAFETHFAQRGEYDEQPYHPENERFGGETARIMAEEHFHISTRVVLERMRRENYTYGDALFDALRLNLTAGWAAGFDRQRTGWYFDELCKQWIPVFFESTDGNTGQLIGYVEADFHRAFENQAAVLGEELNEFWKRLEAGEIDKSQPEWLRWLRGCEMIFKELGPQLDRALPNLIHLNNNRLGLSNQDETYVNYILARVFET